MAHFDTAQVTRKEDVGIIKFEHGFSSATRSSAIGDIAPPTTPLSPSSMYTTSEIRGVPHGIINAVMLSSWDHILGPRIQHMWFLENSMKLNQKTLSYICGQTLSGEICRDTKNTNIDIKFYNLPDNGLIVPAFIFSIVHKTNALVYSLSLMISNSEMKSYLGIYDIMQSCFQRLVEKLRILINKVIYCHWLPSVEI